MSSNTLWFVLAVAIMLVLGPKLHLPTPYMLGPMLGAALLSVAGLEAPSLPHWSVLTAQVLVGAHMGVTTSLSSLDNWKKLLPYALFGAIGIVLFSLGTGYLLTLWHPMSLLTAFLGSAPGGMTEMGVTGAALGADLSIIVAYQMFRLLFILFIAPYIVKGLLRLYRGRTDSPVKGF
jgi:membrane AbrB-like protein